MKNKHVLLAISLGILSSCNNSDKTATDTATTADTSTTSATTAKDTSDGWVSLFDGQTTAGWHSYGKDKAGDRWKVADGVLYLDTSKKAGYQTEGGGDLVSNAEYGNFDLK